MLFGASQVCSFLYYCFLGWFTRRLPSIMEVEVCFCVVRSKYLQWGWCVLSFAG